MSRPDILGRDRVLALTWESCHDMAQPSHDRVGTTGPRHATTALWARTRQGITRVTKIVTIEGCHTIGILCRNKLLTMVKKKV